MNQNSHDPSSSCCCVLSVPVYGEPMYQRWNFNWLPRVGDKIVLDTRLSGYTFDDFTVLAIVYLNHSSVILIEIDGIGGSNWDESEQETVEAIVKGLEGSNDWFEHWRELLPDTNKE